MFKLSGRVLVTGGTRGIGRAISIHFARAGALVTAVYVRDEKAADEMRHLARQEGLAIDLCRADLSNSLGIAQVRKAIADQSNGISGFIHCAATGVHRPITELTTHHFDWTFAINVRSFFELLKALTDQFSPPASVVAVSSIGATRALPFYSLVGSSKGALEALARHFSVELAPRGIRVNILVPGSVVTDAWNIMPHGGERLRASIEHTPIGRLVTAEEVALAAHFLCSDASRGVIGHTLVVDGGASIMSCS